MVKKFNAKFRVGQGGLKLVTSDVTLGEGEDALVLVDATAGPVTVTLQRADGSGGKRTTIKKTDTSGNDVIVQPKAGQTIDGGGSLVLDVQNDFLCIISDNENWFVESENMISQPIPHNFLSTTHLDTDPATPPATGSLVKGDGANLWAEFVIGAADTALLVNAAGTNLIYALIKNQNVDPTAAIAQSKLAAIALGDLPNLPALGVAPASPRQTDIVNDEIAVAAAIAQSKIAGLVAALGTKVDTISDVGAGVGKITKAIVGTDAQFRSILAGAGITINNLTDEIEIVATGITVPSLLLHNIDTRAIVAPETRFVSLAGMDDGTTVSETNAENSFPVAVKLKNMTIRVSSAPNAASTMVLRVNNATVNQTVTIPASTTGTFRDVTNTDNIALNDVANYQVDSNGVGTLTVDSMAIEVVSQ